MGILHHTVRTVFTLLGSVALVGGATALVAANAPDGVRELRAYEAAPHCPAAPTTRAECRWTQEFTVSAIHLIKQAPHARGKDSAVLTSADGAQWKTFYNNRGPVLERLHDGDHVTATIWRGHLTEITAKGADQTTDQAPADMRTRSLIVALFLVPSGLVMAVACAWRLLRRRSDPTPGMEATLGVGFGLIVVGLFSAFLVGIVFNILSSPTTDGNFWLTAAVFVPAAAILTAVVRRNVKRQARPGHRGRLVR